MDEFRLLIAYLPRKIMSTAVGKNTVQIKAAPPRYTASNIEAATPVGAANCPRRFPLNHATTSGAMADKTSVPRRAPVTTEQACRFGIRRINDGETNF